MKIQSTAKLSATLVLAASALAACGSDEPAIQTPEPMVAKPQAKPADPTAKMARAVVSGKTTAAVELRYDVAGKPEPGKLIEVDLALIPTAVAESLAVTVTGTPGLEVVSNATATYNSLKIGQVAHQKITIRSQRAEVGYLTVTATVIAVGLTSARTFAIPLIFSDPASAAAAADARVTTGPQAKPDATGQKIQSMPAQETSK